MRKTPRNWAFGVEPPIGIEPMTYALREARLRAPAALPAQMPTADRSDCPLRTRRTGHSFQISFHVPGRDSRRSVTEGDGKAQLLPGAYARYLRASLASSRMTPLRRGHPCRCCPLEQVSPVQLAASPLSPNRSLSVAGS